MEGVKQEGANDALDGTCCQPSVHCFHQPTAVRCINYGMESQDNIGARDI